MLRFALNQSKNKITKNKSLFFSSKKFIHYQTPNVFNTVDNGLKQSQTVNTLFSKITQFEVNRQAQLQEKIRNISPEHDIHIIPNYRKMFLEAQRIRNELRIKYQPAIAPHYIPKTNTISIMQKDDIDALSHEFRHHYDKIIGNIDWDIPEHKLAAELLAFHAQEKVALELSLPKPLSWSFNTPYQMAKSYEGKINYPGTLTNSINSVIQYLNNKQSTQVLNEENQQTLRFLKEYQN